jgi:hypothetical protein
MVEPDRSHDGIICRIRFACWITMEEDTSRIFTNYSFSTETMIKGKRLNITFIRTLVFDNDFILR